MLIENFSAMVQNADQAPDLVRALIDFAGDHAAALAHATTENQGDFLALKPWPWSSPPWHP